MSHEYTQRPPSTTTAPSNLSISHDPKQEIARLNAQILHLTNEILPKAPYLISVPSDVPYRHTSRPVNSWHLGTLFAREEEPLQYMSFLTHQDQEQGLIKALGGWSDESGNLVDEDPSPPTKLGSGANSPLPNGQRKKISLNDYKSKVKGPEEINKKDGMGHSHQRQLRSEELQLNNGAAENEAKIEVKGGAPLDKPQERKRSFHEAISASSSVKSPKPQKRARTKSPARARSPVSPVKKTERANSNKKRLPSLLSPTLPPSDDVGKIPDLLSPTLPASIEDLLAHDDDQQRASGKNNHQRSDSVRSLLGGSGLESSPLAGPKKIVMARTDHERHLSPALQIDLKEARTSPGARGRDSTSSPGPRRRHIIVLKYGKRNKKRVEALLKFGPRSKKIIPKPEPREGEKIAPSRGVKGSMDSPQEQASNREKRGPTSHPSEPPSKRAKIPPPPLNLSEKATTPIPPAFKSPSIQNSILPRTVFTTPKKELKTTAMRRVESTDGLDARTPIANVTRQSTPASTERPPSTTIKPSSPPDMASLPASRDDLRRSWRAVNVKYFDLGRSLKHEGQSLLQQAEPSPSSKKQGILLTIEALLCFILNTTALSHAKNGSDPGWRTILPYLTFVQHVSSPHPHLQGLVAQLAAVCRQIISKYDMERLAREPLPDDHSNGSAPTPGSDGNTKSSTTTEDVEKARRRWNTFRAEMTENARELPRAWLEGYQKLGPDAVRGEFPEAWEGREREAGLKGGGGGGIGGAANVAVVVVGSDRSQADMLGGRYFLPLDANTGSMEAVRFARAVLGEWAQREMGTGVWKSRIEM